MERALQAREDASKGSATAREGKTTAMAELLAVGGSASIERTIVVEDTRELKSNDNSVMLMNGLAFIVEMVVLFASIALFGVAMNGGLLPIFEAGLHHVNDQEYGLAFANIVGMMCVAYGIPRAIAAFNSVVSKAAVARFRVLYLRFAPK